VAKGFLVVIAQVDVPDGTIPSTHAGVVGIEDKLGSTHLDAAALIKSGTPMGYEGLKREDIQAYQQYHNDPYFEIGLAIPANNFPNPMTVRLHVLHFRCRNLAKLCGLRWYQMKFEPSINMVDHVIRVKITIPSDTNQNDFRKHFKTAVMESIHAVLEKSADDVKTEYGEWMSLEDWTDEDK